MAFANHDGRYEGDRKVTTVGVEIIIFVSDAMRYLFRIVLRQIEKATCTKKSDGIEKEPGG